MIIIGDTPDNESNWEGVQAIDLLKDSTSLHDLTRGSEWRQLN